MAVVITREDKDVVVVWGSKIKPTVSVLPALAINRLVDPTGCGDSFAAGFISSFIRRRDVLSACRSGLTLAAKKAGFSGLKGFFDLL